MKVFLRLLAILIGLGVIVLVGELIWMWNTYSYTSILVPIVVTVIVIICSILYIIVGVIAYLLSNIIKKSNKINNEY